MTPDATVLMPFGGNAAYGRLAVDSMIRHSRKCLGLLMVIEPMATERSGSEWR